MLSAKPQPSLKTTFRVEASSFLSSPGTPLKLRQSASGVRVARCKPFTACSQALIIRPLGKTNVFVAPRTVVTNSIPVSGPGGQQIEPSGAPAGQITSALMDSMRQKISEALETDKVTVQDVYGDGRHVSIDVVSAMFDGKNPVQRQRMVYKAIWMELQEAVHAVDDMSTKTPAEAGL